MVSLSRTSKWLLVFDPFYTSKMGRCVGSSRGVEVVFALMLSTAKLIKGYYPTVQIPSGRSALCAKQSKFVLPVWFLQSLVEMCCAFRYVRDGSMKLICVSAALHTSTIRFSNRQTDDGCFNGRCCTNATPEKRSIHRGTYPCRSRDSSPTLESLFWNVDTGCFHLFAQGS